MADVHHITKLTTMVVHLSATVVGWRQDKAYDEFTNYPVRISEAS
jgi:hypothetical protein